MQRRQCTAFVLARSTKIWIKLRTFWDRSGNFCRQTRERCRSEASEPYFLLLSCPVLSCPSTGGRDADIRAPGAGCPRPVPVPWRRCPRPVRVPQRRFPRAGRVRETGTGRGMAEDVRWTRPISRRGWRRRSLQRKIQLMNMRSTSTYPDISDILARKAEGRRELASRSFAEKVGMLEVMRESVEPTRKAREARRRPAASASRTRHARDKRIKSSPTPFPRDPISSPFPR